MFISSPTSPSHRHAGRPGQVLPFPNLQDDLDGFGPPPWLMGLSVGFLGLMVLMALALLSWSWFGTVEESVPGTGQMVPDGKLRRVMTPMSGIVSEVYVSENQHVQAGQKLLVLDPEAAQIDKSGFQEELAMLQQESLALQAAATGINPGRLDPIQQAWLDSTRRSYRSQSQEIEMQIEAGKHAHQQAIAQQNSLQTIVDSKKQQLQKLKQLYEQGGLPKKDVTDYEQDVQLQQGQLESAIEVVSTRKAEIEQAESRRKTLTDKYRQDLMGRVLDHSSRMTMLRSQIAQTKLSIKREVITAPISGTINEQLVHNPGEVVAGGNPLLTIVPDDAGINAEIKVANRDMGYIQVGQKVGLRLEAYPYQRFGRLWGTITAISPASHVDQEGHSFFILKVKPSRTAFTDDKGVTFPLRAGMSISADIITRDKKILGFFTESMHERIDKAFREPTTR